MYCFQCGTKNIDDYKYCTQCGSPSHTLERLLTTKEVAEILTVSVAWVKKHCDQERPFLPHVKLSDGERVMRRFQRDQILTFIAVNRTLPRRGSMR